MIDVAKIMVRAGGGGNGCASFRREKFVPRGGPDGGDGGDGGNVYIVGDPSLNTLLHLKYHSTWRGRRGVHGGGSKRRGANGGDITIPVPLGTVVWEVKGDEERELVADVTRTDAVLVARGGSGGQGNIRFVSALHKEPVLSEAGEGGERKVLALELKLLADVGLVGRPNAGKSSLLAMCSAARPKIAGYPFTTTDPVLGVVATGYSSFVMMEVPGLIEGAHDGAGLGHEFLRHAERARLFLHILDGLSDDPVGDWRMINSELAAFDSALGTKPQLVVLNKVDVPEVRERSASIERVLAGEGATVLVVSATTGEGVDALVGKTMETLGALPVEPAKTVRPVPLTIRPKVEHPFRVTRQDRVFVVEAPRVERLLAMANLKEWRVMVQIWRELEKLGISKALEDKGVQAGDTVRVGSVNLQWF